MALSDEFKEDNLAWHLDIQLKCLCFYGCAAKYSVSNRSVLEHLAFDGIVSK